MARDEAIEVIGRYNAAGTLFAIRNNLEDPEAAAPLVWAILNQEFEDKFDAWNGYLVDSGALRDSLTHDSAEGALRRAHNQAIEFGSTIYYARFHARALLDLPSDTETKVSEGVAQFLSPEGRGGWNMPASHMGGLLSWSRFLDEHGESSEEEGR